MAMNPATENRRLKRVVQDLKRDLGIARVARLDAQNTIYNYRVRATKAEQEAAEWKQRCDALLSKLPDLKGEPQG